MMHECSYQIVYPPPLLVGEIECMDAVGDETVEVSTASKNDLKIKLQWVGMFSAYQKWCPQCD